MRFCSGLLVALLVVTLVAAAGAHPAHVFAQDTATTTAARNSVFLEIGGNALLYSINYDRKISEHISLRTGVAGIPRISVISPTLSSPNMINYTIGRGDERLEIGIGFTAAITRTYVGEKDDTVTRAGVAPTAALGYRYQPVEDGWFIRGSFTPVFSGEGPLAWVGFSIGQTW